MAMILFWFAGFKSSHSLAETENAERSFQNFGFDIGIVATQDLGVGPEALGFPYLIKFPFDVAAIETCRKL